MSLASYIRHAEVYGTEQVFETAAGRRFALPRARETSS